MNTLEQNAEVLEGLSQSGHLRGAVASFRSLSSARNAAYVTAVTNRRVVMGEEGWYWVVSPADAERLVQAGYETLS
jgi:hypothetical protein